MNGKRIHTVTRDQMQWRCESLDQLLPDDHTARGVWAFVCAMNTALFFEPIQVNAHSVGRSAFDPRVLLTLWIYAVYAPLRDEQKQLDGAKTLTHRRKPIVNR